MFKMRLFVLSLLVLCTVAPVLGDITCRACRSENPSPGHWIYTCGTPEPNTWGTENCRQWGTLDPFTYNCDDDDPPQCYYTEVGGGPDWGECPDGNNCEQQDNCGGACSPIIIDTDEDGYALTDGAHGVAFDIDGNGTANRISWTSAGDDDAFLWIDDNNNGVVDNGMELFGDAVYDNGFDKLRAFDAASRGGNGDGLIDASDAIWASLRLWRDSNHNGTSEPAEISTMAASGFQAIGVEFKVVGKRDKFGNQYRYKGRIYNGGKSADKVYDIIFRQAH